MFINHPKLVDDFKRLAQNDGLSHAYLFFGGDKKTHQEKFVFSLSLANFLEKEIFEKPEEILNETLIIFPDEKGTIGIDSVRALKYFLWQKPVNSTRRVAIIKEAENLTDEAQNAALKIVEEPPEFGLIIFIAKTAEDLFPTLASRTQKVYFASKTRINTDKERINTDNQYKSDKISINPRLKSPRESVLSEVEVDQIFEDLISDLKKDPIKNSRKLKEVLIRLTLMKQFNTNKKLQWRSLGF